jgi:hypothetical protein
MLAMKTDLQHIANRSTKVLHPLTAGRAAIALRRLTAGRAAVVLRHLTAGRAAVALRRLTAGRAALQAHHTAQAVAEARQEVHLQEARLQEARQEALAHLHPVQAGDKSIQRSIKIADYYSINILKL